MAKSRDPQVVNKVDGTGSYGILFEWVNVRSDGSFENLNRAFLVGELLCTYTKRSEDKRAAWTTYSYEISGASAARAFLRAALNHPLAVMTAKPILVEMSPSDIESIKRAEAPTGRQAGIISLERITGKINPEDTFVLGGEPF